jgi:hypothetical protein
MKLLMQVCSLARRVGSPLSRRAARYATRILKIQDSVPFFSPWVKAARPRLVWLGSASSGSRRGNAPKPQRAGSSLISGDASAVGNNSLSPIPVGFSFRLRRSAASAIKAAPESHTPGIALLPVAWIK